MHTATVAAHRPLRVALVTETYPPEINGVAQTVRELERGLRQRGHRVQLVRPRQAHDAAPRAATAEHEPARAADHDAAFATTDEPAPSPPPGDGALLVRGLPIPRYPQLRMGLPAARVLARAWQRERPDVVHIATEGPLGWSALRAARRLALPVSSDFRTNFHAYSSHYGAAWLRRPLLAWLRHFHNAAGATMVPTLDLRDALAAEGFERLHVVGRGVDSARFHPAHRSAALRAHWCAGHDDVVLLSVGRLAAEKNLELLLAAYDAARWKHRGVRLVLVGDGPLAPGLRARVPDAVFAGVQRGAALAAHYASADLFVFPSLTETYGNVTAEAMASGLAVVAYRHAAAATLIRHGIDGLLAEPGDHKAFAQLVVSAVTHPARRHALGQHARARAGALGWPQVLAQFEEVLRSVHPRASAHDRAAAPCAATPLLP